MMTTETKMVYRAISNKTAQWIGMAASVAGGWIDVDDDTYLVDIEKKGMLDHYEKCNDGSLEDAEADYPHIDATGNRFRLVHFAESRGPCCLIMCVPESSGLASEGWALPDSLVAEYLAKK